MKYAGKIVLMALLFALMSGCASRRNRVKTSSTAQAPTTNDQVGALSTPPLSQPVPPPAVIVPEPSVPKETPPPAAPPQPKPSTRKKWTTSKSKPSAAKPAGPQTSATESATPPAPAANTPAPKANTPASNQKAANVEPSGASPIGQISSGEGAAGPQKRRDTSDLINSTEQGLNGIKRRLNTPEREIADRIRTYVKQARHAMTVDDLDGASTLATKAKVLLEELTKP